VKKQSKKRNPTSVLRRNARERDRIRTVNDAFDHLRDHVPNGDAPKGRKISKVETLKSAIEYIHALKSVLGDDFAPMNLCDDLSDTDFPEDASPGRSPESGLGSNETSVDYDKEINIETVAFGNFDDFSAFSQNPNNQLSPNSTESIPEVGFENYDFLQSTLPPFDATLPDQFEFC